MSRYKQAHHLMQNRPAGINDVIILRFNFLRREKLFEKNYIPADEVQHAENVPLLECPCEQQSVKMYQT